MNTQEIGIMFENKAKEILEKNNYLIKEHKSKINWESNYDFKVNKDGIDYYVEVKGTSKNNSWFLTENKVRHLLNLGDNILIMCINKDKWFIFKLIDIFKYGNRITTEDGEKITIQKSRCKCRVINYKPKIIKIGNSHGIRVSKELMDIRGIHNGDLVEFTLVQPLPNNQNKKEIKEHVQQNK